MPHSFMGKTFARPLRSWMFALLGVLVLCACDSPISSGGDGDGEVPTAGDGTFLPLSPASVTATLVNFDAAGNRLSRFDVDGGMVDVHDGGIYEFKGTYYWYGTTYGCGYEWKKLAYSPFCGFRVYTSPDLVHWKDGGLLFDVSQWEPWQARCHGWSYGCFRPHVAYNPNNGRYVLWVNTYETSVDYHVLDAPTPVGPFTEAPLPRLATNANAPIGVNNGDHDLFVDDDGKGYLVHTNLNGGDIVVEALTPDFLSGTGNHVRLGLQFKESPSMFKRGGRYYITMSDPNCGYCTTGTAYVTATAPLGPWSAPKKLTTTSCGGQPTHVSQLPTAEGGKWYLYQSDLWNNAEPNEATADQFWAPLVFNSAGDIQPISCRPTYGVSTAVSGGGGTTASAARWRLQCEIGTRGVTGEVQREVRFTPATSGRLRSVALTAYQKNFPSGPLVVEVRAPAASGGGVLSRAEIQQPSVLWAPSRHTLPMDVAVTGGAEYAVRIRAATTQGCYGVVYRDDQPTAGQKVFVSRDGGTSWTAEPQRRLGIETTVTAE